ncbi:MAG: NAD-dependent epimerase/dehydratase family protein [Candidatus Lokiarchaeota archaeon]
MADIEQFFNEKHVLVTGAAGFIGSNLTDKFLELGAKVTGIDNLFNGRLQQGKMMLIK